MLSFSVSVGIGVPVLPIHSLMIPLTPRNNTYHAHCSAYCVRFDIVPKRDIFAASAFHTEQELIQDVCYRSANVFQPSAIRLTNGHCDNKPRCNNTRVFVAHGVGGY